MVLEYGDIDLARLLHNHEESKRRDRAAAAATSAAFETGGGGGGEATEGRRQAEEAEAPGSCVQMDENFVRLYWQQMLQVDCA